MITMLEDPALLLIPVLFDDEDQFDELDLLLGQLDLNSTLIDLKVFA